MANKRCFEESYDAYTCSSCLLCDLSIANPLEQLSDGLYYCEMCACLMKRKRVEVIDLCESSDGMDVEEGSETEDDGIVAILEPTNVEEPTVLVYATPERSNDNVDAAYNGEDDEDDVPDLGSIDSYYSPIASMDQGYDHSGDFDESFLAETAIGVSYSRNITLDWNEEVGAYVDVVDSELSDYSNDGF